MNADPHEYPFDMLALMWPVVSSFGGGLNSTALLVKWVLDKNAPIDKIIFADTGGEREITPMRMSIGSANGYSSTECRQSK